MKTFYWLVKREFWENRGSFLFAPVICGGVVLLLTLMGVIAGEVFRSRAGVPAFTTLTRALVRKERRRELAFEGLRLFDVVRWRIGKDLNDKLIHSNIRLKWDDKFYIWPFSQSEMDINKALVQNEGY